MYSHILEEIHNILNSCQRISILNVTFYCNVSLFTSLLLSLCSVSIGKRRDIFNAALLVLFEIQSKLLFDIFFLRFKLGRCSKNNVEKTVTAVCKHYYYTKHTSLPNYIYILKKKQGNPFFSQNYRTPCQPIQISLCKSFSMRNHGRKSKGYRQMRL